jgi:hypothetical protein
MACVVMHVLFSIADNVAQLCAGPEQVVSGTHNSCEGILGSFSKKSSPQETLDAQLDYIAEAPGSMLLARIKCASLFCCCHVRYVSVADNAEQISSGDGHFQGE